MPDLASTDVTVTVQVRRRTAKERRNLVKIAFGNGTLTYPSGGVPLPSFLSFGMFKALDYLVISDNDDGTGLVWKYDQENNKLRCYSQGWTTGSTAAADSTSGRLIVNEAAAESAFRAMGVTTATTVVGQALKENTAASFAPPSTVIYAEAVGQ